METYPGEALKARRSFQPREGARRDVCTENPCRQATWTHEAQNVLEEERTRLDKDLSAVGSVHIISYHIISFHIISFHFNVCKFPRQTTLGSIPEGCDSALAWAVMFCRSRRVRQDFCEMKGALSEKLDRCWPLGSQTRASLSATSVAHQMCRQNSASMCSWGRVDGSVSIILTLDTKSTSIVGAAHVLE